MSEEKPIEPFVPRRTAQPATSVDAAPAAKADDKPSPKNNITFPVPEDPKQLEAYKKAQAEQFKGARVIQAVFPAGEIKIRYNLQPGDNYEQGIAALKEAVHAARWGKPLPENCSAISVSGCERDPSRLAVFLDESIDQTSGICSCVIQSYQ